MDFHEQTDKKSKISSFHIIDNRKCRLYADLTYRPNVNNDSLVWYNDEND